MKPYWKASLVLCTGISYLPSLSLSLPTVSFKILKTFIFFGTMQLVYYAAIRQNN